MTTELKTRFGPAALITGASDGIGRACRVGRWGYFTGTGTLSLPWQVPRWPWMARNFGAFGRFLGRRVTTALYRWDQDPVDPLTYHAPNGCRYRPRSGLTTDMGSIPAAVQCAYPKDRFLKAYLLHDSGYDDQGLAVAEAGADSFAFRELRRDAVDDLLFLGVAAEGALRIERNAI